MTTTTSHRHMASPPVWPLTLAVVAVLPYLTLKGLWLSGSSIGLSAQAAREMGTSRFVVGNAITVGLELVALALAWSLTRPWATRFPTGLFVVLSAGASGLLAPILIGMPLGQVAQTLAHGRPSFSGEGMEAWVFACVYGGFTLLGLALAISLTGYASRRWGSRFTTAPRVRSPATFALGAATFLPFGLAMTWWGARGPGTVGPQGMEAPVQRVVLLVTGLLTVAAVLIPVLLRPLRTTAKISQFAWLTVWLGCCTAALQGPTQLLLAHGGTIQPAVAAIALLATPGALVLGLGLRQGEGSGG